MGDANASAAVFQDGMGVGKQVATKLCYAVSASIKISFS